MILQVIAHNIRSAQNVGSILRSADGLGASKVWIVGYTPTPDLPKVKKTALGAEDFVDWEQEVDIVKLLTRLRLEGFQIVALERTARSIQIGSFVPADRVALLLGNEVEGVPPSLLDSCDVVVEIPQSGQKESLNVSIAAAIAMYAFHHHSGKK